jgi:hypothetical protein
MLVVRSSPPAPTLKVVLAEMPARLFSVRMPP